MWKLLGVVVMLVVLGCGDDASHCSTPVEVHAPPPAKADFDGIYLGVLTKTASCNGAPSYPVELPMQWVLDQDQLTVLGWVCNHLALTVVGADRGVSAGSCQGSQVGSVVTSESVTSGLISISTTGGLNVSIRTNSVAVAPELGGALLCANTYAGKMNRQLGP